MNMLFIVIGILSIIYIINKVRKGIFSVNESFFWICGGIAILVLSIFPQIIIWLSNLAGIDYPPSLLFMLCIIFLVFMNFRNCRKIAEHQEKIIELAQNLTLLKSKVDDK